MKAVKNIGTMVLPAVFGCAAMQHEVKSTPTEVYQNQQVVSQLEAMTAAGQFPVVAAYVHQQIDQHPTQYMNELYGGAEVALKHAPNGVYMLAARLYQEDMKEDMQSMSEALEWMSDHGFSYSYDLNYDE